MRADRSEAIKLRLQGQSYSQIQKELKGISKSTLSLWLKDVSLSDSARAKIDQRTRERSLAGLIKRNKLQTKKAEYRKNKARAEARKEVGTLSDKDLWLSGIALYWAEGYKQPIFKDGREVSYHPVSLTNSDPKLIQLFLRFVREVCKVSEEKIRADLRIFQHLNEKELLLYWQEKTAIPKERFGKVYVGISKSSQGKRPFNRLPYGVIQIRINDTQLFHRIMGWIEGLKNQMPR